MLPTNTVTKDKRLVVLVPDGLAGNDELARRVYRLAEHGGYEVFYLAMFDSDDSMLATMRHMATMKAVTAGEHITVESRVVETAGWLAALREVYRPGDRIACQAEQVVRAGFLKTVSLAAFLEENLHAHVTTIAGLYHPERQVLGRWARGLVTWVGFLVILAAFTFLEIRLEIVSAGPASKLILGALFTLEIGLIWAWDRLAGQTRI